MIRLKKTKSASAEIERLKSTGKTEKNSDTGSVLETGSVRVSPPVKQHADEKLLPNLILHDCRKTAVENLYSMGALRFLPLRRWQYFVQHEL